MRKWIGIALALLSSPLWAKGGGQYLDIKDFHCGVDTYHSSLQIDDCFVQDSLNVYFDKQAGFEKRKGFTVAFSSKAYSFSGSWSYTDSANNTWMIVRSSDTIMATTGVGQTTFNIKVATVTATDVVNAVSAFGNIYFVDRTQGGYYWNGTSTTYVSGSPHGSLIAQFHNRIWITGLSVPNGNYLYGSKYLDGTTWATGINATDPVLLQIALQDNFDNITALFSGFNDTLYIFKNYSIHGLYGFDQTDFQTRGLNAEVGCVEQRSIQPIFGGLVFASLRGFEFFDGYNATRISDPVKNIVDSALSNPFSARSWTQNSAVDFSGGSGYATFTDTTTSSGDVQLSGQTDLFVTTTAWTSSSGTWTLSGGAVTTPSYDISASQFLGSTVTINSGWYTRIRAMQNTAATYAPLICTGVIKASTNQGYYGCLTADFITGSWYVSITTVPANSRFASSASNPIVLSSSYNFVAYDGNYHNLELTRTSSGAMTLLLDSVVRVSTTNTSLSGLNQGVLYGVPGTVGGGHSVDDFYLVSSTGIYYSAVNNAPNLTSWANFSVNDSANSGTIAYYTRSSTNTFSVTSTTPTWVAQTKNATVASSTGTYFQARIDYTVTSATQSPATNDFTFNWFEGTAKPPMASAVYDNRYWVSLTTNTADSVNNATLVLSKGPVWTIFSHHAGTLLLWKNNLYHGDADSTGKLYQDEQGYSDNSTAINAYVKTKDFAPQGLIADKFFDSLYLVADNLGSYTISTTYYIDRVSTGFTLGDMLQNETSGTLINRLNIPIDSTHQNFGRTISFKFQQNQVDAPFKFYGGAVRYRVRPPT